MSGWGYSKEMEEWRSGIHRFVENIYERHPDITMDDLTSMLDEMFPDMHYTMRGWYTERLADLIDQNDESSDLTTELTTC